MRYVSFSFEQFSCSKRNTSHLAFVILGTLLGFGTILIDAVLGLSMMRPWLWIPGGSLHDSCRRYCSSGCCQCHQLCFLHEGFCFPNFRPLSWEFTEVSPNLGTVEMRESENIYLVSLMPFLSPYGHHNPWSSWVKHSQRRPNSYALEPWRCWHPKSQCM